MAMFVRRKFNIVCFYFVQTLFSIVIASQIVDESPSILNLNIHQIDDGYLQNADLYKTVYHIQKRSAVTTSVRKKASETLEKKFLPKDTSTQLDKLKNAAINASVSNSTNTDNSTDVSSVATNSANEYYNISGVSETLSNSTTVSSSTSTTTTTTTTTTASSLTSTTTTSSSSVPTPFADVLPTRPADITNTTEDHHIYYNSSFFAQRQEAMAYWVNFDELPQDRVVVHRMLSDSHRRAATVTLSFDFPFYGHPLRNITIATGGFVYMGDYMHSWLAATQYIAPLMANFDTSLSDESTVRYFDNGTAFVIEWHEVTLQDKKKDGNFTFQATLLNNGNIVFVYNSVPLNITDIGDESHPVKVGLSDAYVIDRIIYFIRRKTIYEYHRIDMKRGDIRNHTAIYFTSLTTCLSFQDCTSCMAAEVGLNCVWCDSAKRCSDGLDRLRQDWLQSKCDVEKSSINCSALPSPGVNPYVQPLTDSPSKTYTLYPRTSKPDYPRETTTVPYMPDNAGRRKSDDGASTSARVAEDSSAMGVGSVVAILLILAVVMGGLVWVGYAYRNPHTSSGQLLIRYRPSQWRFRSGEARYTAASVHM